MPGRTRTRAVFDWIRASSRRAAPAKDKSWDQAQEKRSCDLCQALPGPFLELRAVTAWGHQSEHRGWLQPELLSHPQLRVRRGQRWGSGGFTASGVPGAAEELQEAVSRGFPGFLQDLGGADFRMWWNQCWSVLPGCAEPKKKRRKNTQGQQL